MVAPPAPHPAARSSLRRPWALAGLALAVSLAFAHPHQEPPWPYRPDRLLVQPRPHASPQAWQSFHDAQGVRILHTYPDLHHLQVLQLPPHQTVPQLLAAYQACDLTEFAEPDYLVHLAAHPNDPRYLDGSLWGLHNTGQNGGLEDADIDAPEAWDLQTTAPNIVVAVLDTGARLTHEDLAPNLWRNPADGSHGYNAFTGQPDPTDDQGHGTLVAGILGAVGNNGRGVVGVAWRVQLMPIKALDSSGVGSDSTLIAGLEFARTHGAHIVNASLDSPAPSLALSNAIASLRQHHIILVTSSGNNAQDVDQTPRYPACYPFDHILSVAFTDRQDSLGSLSNFGQTNVDLAAPAGGMPSTFFTSDTSYLGASAIVGTSFAAPQVAAAAALLRARYPADSPQQTILRLLYTTDPLPSLAHRCTSGGRLNLRRALASSAHLALLPGSADQPRCLRLTSEPATVWIVERSPDLRHWTPFATNTLPLPGAIDFCDPLPPAQPTFYRALLAPR